MATANDYIIVKTFEGYVKPAAPTPVGKLLTLSSVDRHPVYRFFVNSLHIFTQGDQPAKVIKDALAKALVPYYPLAGRIVQHEPTLDLKLECTGQGIWFAEAQANCSLKDVNYLEQPTVFSQKDLCADTELENDQANTIIAIQITEFKCGGFAMGLSFYHAGLDGFGAAQFINAVGELARGLAELTVKPIWERDAYPNPNFKYAPHPPLPNLDLDYMEVDFPLDYITRLKSQFMEYAATHCSTFDLIVSKAWQCCVKAIDSNPDANVRMLFTADTRDILKIKNGYYGNSIHTVQISATNGQIAGSSLFEIVELMKKAKERMSAEVLSWANGEETTQVPSAATVMPDTFLVADWSKLGFSETDYGWGTPMYYGPFLDIPIFRSCLLVKSPAPLQGSRLITTCVSKEYMDSFKKLISNFD